MPVLPLVFCQARFGSRSGSGCAVARPCVTVCRPGPVNRSDARGINRAGTIRRRSSAACRDLRAIKPSRQAPSGGAAVSTAKVVSGGSASRGLGDAVVGYHRQVVRRPRARRAPRRGRGRSRRQVDGADHSVAGRGDRAAGRPAVEPVLDGEGRRLPSGRIGASTPAPPCRAERPPRLQMRVIVSCMRRGQPIAGDARSAPGAGRRRCIRILAADVEPGAGPAAFAGAPVEDEGHGGREGTARSARPAACVRGRTEMPSTCPFVDEARHGRDLRRLVLGGWRGQRPAFRGERQQADAVEESVRNGFGGIQTGPAFSTRTQRAGALRAMAWTSARGGSPSGSARAGDAQAGAFRDISPYP